MATTPLLTIAVTIDGLGVAAAAQTSSATDTIKIYKVEENGSLTILSSGITMSLIEPGVYGGQFINYTVPSGQITTYMARAVDGSGGTADSATIDHTLTLTSAALHAVSKTNPDTNADTGDINQTAAVSLIEVAPRARRYGLESARHILAGASLPAIGVGSVERLGVSFSAIIPLANDSKREIVRNIFKSRRYVCLRDGFGEMWFGRLLPPSEAYDYHSHMSIEFQELDFTEAVA